MACWNFSVSWTCLNTTAYALQHVTFVPESSLPCAMLSLESLIIDLSAGYLVLFKYFYDMMINPFVNEELIVSTL